MNSFFEKIFKYPKYKYLEWKWDRVLRKSRFNSWWWYFYYMDPGYDPQGVSPQEVLPGYQHIAKVPYDKLDEEFDALSGGVNYNWEKIEQWCIKHCRGKFRHYWFREVKDHEGQYLKYGLYPKDYLLVAFTDERDYTLFTLVWL